MLPRCQSDICSACFNGKILFEDLVSDNISSSSSTLTSSSSRLSMIRQTRRVLQPSTTEYLKKLQLESPQGIFNLQFNTNGKQINI